jgi:signal transduction histidine kinase/ActR/RegA family two-component response regulator
MREPSTAATGLRGLAVRIRRTSLAVKITALGALVTAIVVFVAFGALSMETRASARRVYAEELSRHQRTLLLLQRQNLTQLISGAALITQSPTLRSALETYRVEANVGRGARPDLVQTVKRELSNLLTRVERDLLVVTDERGRIYAAAARGGREPGRGDDLSRMSAVRRALDPASSADSGELAVYRDGAVSYQVAVYPLVLNGYTIGALLLGERLDQGLVASARAAFDGEIIVTAGRSVLAATLPSANARLADQLLTTKGSADSTRAIQVAGEEMVIAPLELGQTQDGDVVTLWLMQPVGPTVRTLTQPLGRDFILYGTLAVIIAAIGAGAAAGSVLKPFRRFVDYMRSGSAAERLESRFDAHDVPAEVRSLNTSFEQLMASIATKRQELEQRTAELTSANAVLLDEVRQRQRVEHALHESEEQLRQSQKLEAVGTLAGGIAHDFNNLLTAVSGFTQLALMNSDPDSAMAADLRHVVEAADRAAHLTRQLLAFSRKQVLQPTVLDLGDVVRQVAPLLGRVLGEHITLRIQTDESIPRVIADRGQLEQVVMNLAINARDAMPDGGVLTIAASNVADGNDKGRGGGGGGGGTNVRRDPHVVLTVEDTGTGIPDDIRSRIFEPFFTTKEPGKGTGLGLSMVYGIVKQSGGTIDLETKTGVGTKFRITLPAASEAVTPGLVQDIVQTLPTGSETVLVVEDDPDVLALARRTLEERGYRVLAAADAMEALRLARNTAIDVLLTDIVMPQVSGPELVELFLSVHPQPVIIYMSGYADDALKSARLTSTSAFLRKPFSPAVLARTVRDALDAAKRGSPASLAT